MTRPKSRIEGAGNFPLPDKTKTGPAPVSPSAQRDILIKSSLVAGFLAELGIITALSGGLPTPPAKRVDTYEAHETIENGHEAEVIEPEVLANHRGQIENL